MTRLSKTLSALTTTGLVVAGLIAATPAVAAPSSNPFPSLPANQRLIGIDCDGGTNATYSIAVTSTSAVASVIGSAVGNGNDVPVEDADTECTGGIGYNPVDGFVYGILWPGYLSNQLFPNTQNTNYLVKVDPATGVQTLIAEFSGPCNDPWAFTVDNNGVGYATDSPKLCSVNLATGVTTEIGTDMINGPGEPSDYAMGFDFKTGVLYMFSSNYEIYSINTATGVGTLAATLTPSDGEQACVNGGTDSLWFDASAGFDSNGIAWIQSDSCNSTPLAWKPGTNEYWYTGSVVAGANIVNTDGEAIYSAGDDFYIEGFAVATVKDPALAETGVDASELPAGTLIGGGLLLAGAVAWVARRRIAAKR